MRWTVEVTGHGKGVRRAATWGLSWVLALAGAAGCDDGVAPGSGTTAGTPDTTGAVVVGATPDGGGPVGITTGTVDADGNGGLPTFPTGTSGLNPGGTIGSADPSGDGGLPTTDEGGTPTPESTGGEWGTEADYHDPGTGDWEMGTAEECKMDLSKLEDGDLGNYAVFRYGKLCHIKGGDVAGSMYSATKTLGGVMVGRAAYLTRDVPRTGPGTGTIVPEDLATDWLGRVSYNDEATLSHVMAMCGHGGMNAFSYDTIGSTQINTMIDVVEEAISQVGGLPATASAFMQQEVFDRMGMESSRWSTALGISTGWSANLSDMGKLGVLLAHDGWYGGERLLDREWVYRMSHPGFEENNTAYGQLAWLNHRGNAAGIGGDIRSGSNAPLGDPCAPAAFWRQWPHGASAATDCRNDVDGACEQTYDVGVFSAQGLNGQFIVVHPGLDLVIAARNFGGGGGPMGMWAAVRPAIVAADPVYVGDEEAFCEDYGAGSYAPDLIMPRQPPQF